MNIGASAFASASTQAERAASRILEAVHELPVSRPGVGQDVEQAPNLPPISVSLSSVEALDLIGGMVDLMRAEHAYKAGAAIIRTGDEMLNETLDMV